MTDEEALARAKLVFNEKAKLTATFMNGLAIAIVVVGVFSPSFAPRPATPLSADAIKVQLLQIAVCLAMSLCLHFLARRILGSLR